MMRSSRAMRTRPSGGLDHRGLPCTRLLAPPPRETFPLSRSLLMLHHPVVQHRVGCGKEVMDMRRNFWNNFWNQKWTLRPVAHCAEGS